MRWDACANSTGYWSCWIQSQHHGKFDKTSCHEWCLVVHKSTTFHWETCVTGSLLTGEFVIGDQRAMLFLASQKISQSRGVRGAIRVSTLCHKDPMTWEILNDSFGSIRFIHHLSFSERRFNHGIAATRQLRLLKLQESIKTRKLPLFVGGNKKVSSKKMKFCTSTWCLGGVFRSLFLARCLNNCLEVAELKEDTAVLSVTAGRVWRSGEKNCQIVRCYGDGAARIAGMGKLSAKGYEVMKCRFCEGFTKASRSIVFLSWMVLSYGYLKWNRADHFDDDLTLLKTAEARKTLHREEPLSHIFHCLYLRFCCARLFDWSLRWSNRSSRVGVFSTPSSLLKGAPFSVAPRNWEDVAPWHLFWYKNAEKGIQQIRGHFSVASWWPFYQSHAFKTATKLVWWVEVFSQSTSLWSSQLQGMDNVNICIDGFETKSSETQRILSFTWQFATFCN